ncbi:MAG: hypothetical protein ILO42_08110 [Clostridia bacterium]|nr:hypothetical protein [Clostridia bacterium]
MNKKRVLPAIILLVGALMIAAAVTYFAIDAARANKTKKNNEILLDRLNTLIPEPHPGFVEEGRDTIMPVLNVDGVDYIGILTVPAYKAEIPVASVWDDERNKGVFTRYFGTLPAHNLILGADNALGLFGFSGEITKDDSVFFTDTEGIVYSYKVEDVVHVNRISKEEMTYTGLTIFIRSRTSSDYVIVYCK